MYLVAPVCLCNMISSCSGCSFMTVTSIPVTLRQGVYRFRVFRVHTETAERTGRTSTMLDEDVWTLLAGDLVCASFSLLTAHFGAVCENIGT